MMIREYQGRNTLMDETMFNLLDAVSYSGCSEDGDDIFSALLQGGSCLMSGAIKLARVQQYLSCIDYKTEAFYKSYLNWRDTPQQRKMECEAHLNIIANTPDIIEKYQVQIEDIKTKINQKMKQLQQLKDELQTVLKLRDTQSKLLKQLQH